MRTLTPEQEQAAARRTGPLLLAAGAGSGKTSVLVERFVRAVREDGIVPARILALTFTERAAGELRARVRARLLELGEREAAREMEGAPIGTFHGFCARLLRIHAPLAGLDPDFAVLDEAAAGRLRLLAFRRALAALLDGDGARQPRAEAVDLIAAYGADRVRAMVLRVYAEQRSRGVSTPSLPASVLMAAGPDAGEELLREPHALREREAEQGPREPRQRDVEQGPRERDAEQEPCGPRQRDAEQGPREREVEQGPREPAASEADVRALRACALLDEMLRGFGREYAELKRARGALDFDDLELRARELLAEHDGVRRGWAERLELLMVDEFQDTNRRQLGLLELLERGNLFTVGDELQSIYGFRYAEVAIFGARRTELRAQGAALALARNFRARPPLIAAVNAVFGARFGASYTPLVAGREQGDTDEPLLELLLSDRRGWAESRYARAVAGELPPAPLWRQAEARLLAQRVAELVDSGRTAAGEVAVLLRAVGDLPVYERALEEQGLRTLAAVGSFWGHQQVTDLLAWLGALANPLDELALYSTLASPLVGISSDGLALLALQARADASGAWATACRGEGELYERLPARDRERLAAFVARFAAERRVAAALPLAELLLRALAVGDYERHVLALEWGERRLANIHKLLRLARRFEAAEGRDLRGFLDHVAYRAAFEQSAEPQAPTGGAEPDAVRLMTIHAAKGLEFAVVCVADLGRTGNGTPPDLLLDGERVGLRLASLDGAEPVSCLSYEELCEERRLAEAAEEERIVYVAMTRARERLLLSGAVDFSRWPAVKAGAAPIAWLVPALAPEVVEAARTLERPVLELAVGGHDAGGEGVGGKDDGGDDVGGDDAGGDDAVGGRDAVSCARGAARMRCWLNAPATVGEVLRGAAARGSDDC